jgi:Kdo2-lipid IVA lauroyltransferase/acyltransferase
MRDRVLAAAVRRLFALAPLVGFERALRAADAIGDILSHLLRKQSRIAREQLLRALPDTPDPDRVLHEMFRGHARSMVEVVFIDEIERRLDTYVTAEGLEVMDAAIADGRGVVVFTGHLGNWELLAAFFGLRGYPVSVVARPVKGGGRLNAQNVALRARSHVETLLRDDAGVSRLLLRALRKGRLLALLIDQSSKRGQSVPVPFFGRPAPTQIGAAVLALHTGAPVVGAFIERRPSGGHEIRVVRPDLPPREDLDRAGRQAWVVETTRRMTAMVEQEIRRRPQDWVWWHRRWRDPYQHSDDGCASSAST